MPQAPVSRSPRRVAQNDQAKSTSGEEAAAREKATMSAASVRIHGFSSRGSDPNSSSSRSTQRPAMSLRSWSATPATALDPRAVDPLDGPLADVDRPVAELAAGVEEIARLGRAGHGPAGLGEEVEPGRVETAPEREMGVEAGRVVEAVPVVDAHGEEDLLGLAGDEVHQGGHRQRAGPCSAKSMRSRSPGERPNVVSNAAASLRCWVPWFTRWAIVCHSGMPSRSRSRSSSVSPAR